MAGFNLLSFPLYLCYAYRRLTICVISPYFSENHLRKWQRYSIKMLKMLETLPLCWNSHLMKVIIFSLPHCPVIRSDYLSFQLVVRRGFICVCKNKWPPLDEDQSWHENWTLLSGLFFVLSSAQRDSRHRGGTEHSTCVARVSYAVRWSHDRPWPVFRAAASSKGFDRALI